ncbi:hypothetical protein NSQ14_15730 [Caldifermentibacillus hisashii]|uniref:hypothetical protein n=1 Tax=Caldifermentibacillus hisashii TaxID=996558 RepID=UPI0031FCE1C1
MTNPLKIGSVFEVRGTRVKVLVDKEMNHSTFIYLGEIINNITVNGYVIIKKGFIDLVGKIDAEYIDDLLNTDLNQEQDYRYNKGTILRILEVQILGYFENKTFKNGVKQALRCLMLKKQVTSAHRILSFPCLPPVLS